MSIKLAAEELCLTPTAISHRVKALENHFGVRLFHRMTRSLKLTSEGKQLLPFVSEAFGQLRQASVAMTSNDIEGNLVVTTTRSFAWSWLCPRLPKFTQKYPDLKVRVLASDSVLDFARYSVDVSIRHGAGDCEDAHVAWVLDDFVTPICATNIAAGVKSPESLLDMDFVEYEWLGFTEGDPDWANWFKSNGVAPPNKEPIGSFSDEIMCIEAAIDNRATALVSIIAASREIDRGRICAPFTSVLKDRSYYLVCPSDTAGGAKIRAFEEWLLNEADDFRESDYWLRFFSDNEIAAH